LTAAAFTERLCVPGVTIPFLDPWSAMLKPGDQAPDFTATLDDGASFTLSEQRGKVIVLFFYPKDDTPG